MIIWIHVPLKRKVKEGESAEDVQLRAIIERKSMLNLVQAFSVSVKHCASYFFSLAQICQRSLTVKRSLDLRSEPGIYYEDLYPLLSFLPQSVDGTHKDVDESSSKASSEMPANLPMWQETPTGSARSTRPRKQRVFDPEKVLPDVKSAVPLQPARNPPKETIYDVFPPAIIFLPFHVLFKKLIGRRRGDEDGSRNIFGKKKEPEPIESNIPLESKIFYFTAFRTDANLHPYFQSACSCPPTWLSSCVTVF